MSTCHVDLNPDGTRSHTTEGNLVPSYSTVNGVAVNGSAYHLPIFPYNVINVANTLNFSNDTIGFVEFCNQLETNAYQLANDLAALANTKNTEAANVRDDVGNTCEVDFDIQANNFIINCNAMGVDQCDVILPDVQFYSNDFNVEANNFVINSDVQFYSNEFNVNANDDFDVKANNFVINCNSTFTIEHNGGNDPEVIINCDNFKIVSQGVTITVSGGSISISGGTLDLPAGTTVDGSAIATLNHTHTPGTLAADINTGAISGSTGIGS